MPEAGRLGDKSRVPADSHGCPSCPHDAEGGATTGSENVFINDEPALRVGDKGKHSTCCGPNTWTAAAGAPAVFINDRAAHRKGDAVDHCGGRGRLVVGSENVFFGDVVQGAAKGGPAGGVMPTGAASLSSIVKNGGSISPLSPSSFGIKLPLKGWVIGVLAGFAAVTIAAIVSPAVRKFLSDAARLAKYLFTSLFHFLASEGWMAAPRHRCPPEGKEPDPIKVTTDERFNKALAGTDVTEYTRDLITTFRPIIYQDPADLYPISMKSLLEHSTLHDRSTATEVARAPSIDEYYDHLYKGRAAYGGGPSDKEPAWFFVDVEDDFAQKRGSDTKAVVYARATKQSKNQAIIQYAMIRAGSYLPYAADPYEYFEHEGDGEFMSVIVRRDVDTSLWRLREISYGGHGKDGLITCCGRCAVISNDGRPSVYVAKGSHALAPTAERRKAGALWIDVFDGEHELAYGLPRILGLKEGDPASAEHQVVFTRRAEWGEPRWSAPDGPIIGAHSYPGYDETPKGELKDSDKDVEDDDTRCVCKG